MRNNIFSVLFMLTAVVGLSVQSVQAQDDFDKFLEAGLEDANTLVEGYVAPFVKGFGTGLGNGWYNTAATHKKFGFDLTITVNAAYIPDDDLFYSPQFVNAQYAPGSIQPSPTIFGPAESPVYEYSFEENGQTFTGTLDGPEGLNMKDEVGFQAVPVPMANLSIGLVKNTDLKIRWTPEINIGDDGTFKLIGFAAQHDIKQHIPGLKLLPFDMSVLIGFTDITTEVNFVEDLSGTGGGVSTDDGKAVFDINTWTFQAIASKKFSVVTFYGGVGYNIVSSNMGLKGTYDIRDDFGNIERSYIDPIDLNFSQNGLRATAGMRLKFAFFTLHGDYTLQKYNTLTVGLGFNFREN